MPAVAMLLLPAVIYAVPLAIGTLILKLAFRQSVQPVEWLQSLAPIALWLLLVLVRDKGKTLSNLVIEPLVLSLVVLLTVAVNCLAAWFVWKSAGKLQVAMLGGSVVTTAGLYAFMPALPE